MGKKSNCCKKKSTSTSNCCDDSSSSSCSSSRSSSTYGFCCTKYPKCHCVVNKCAPIYYPNNCVGQLPCNPCRPPYPSPYPPPCPPPAQCSPTYNSYNVIITGSPISFNLFAQYTLYIVNPIDTSGNLYLPAISSLGVCCYNKMFIISNISSYTITINPSQTTTTTDGINGLSSMQIPQNSSVSIYSSYISNIGYWSLVSTCSPV